jgi:hypothetical protein
MKGRPIEGLSDWRSDITRLYVCCWMPVTDAWWSLQWKRFRGNLRCKLVNSTRRHSETIVDNYFLIFIIYLLNARIWRYIIADCSNAYDTIWSGCWTAAYMNCCRPAAHAAANIWFYAFGILDIFAPTYGANDTAYRRLFRTDCMTVSLSIQDDRRLRDTATALSASIACMYMIG